MGINYVPVMFLASLKLGGKHFSAVFQAFQPILICT
jgi:hypothetical protein